MTVYVLDASAILRFFDDEAGADETASILRECVRGTARACISAIQWGEVAGRLRLHYGAAEQVRLMEEGLPSEIEVVPVSAADAVAAAALHIDYKLGYADAFALELAARSSDHVLVTADYGFKGVEEVARVQFLPGE